MFTLITIIFFIVGIIKKDLEVFKIAGIFSISSIIEMIYYSFINAFTNTKE